MGKRYYCDYCDKSFADSPSNRRNHLQGLHHQRMRKNHYENFKDSAAILLEADLNACRKFQKTVQQQNEVKCQKRKIAEDSNSTLEEWLAKRANLKKGKNKDDGSLHTMATPAIHLTKPQHDVPQYTLPPFLANIPNLPPSLLPPPPDIFGSLKYQEWG